MSYHHHKRKSSNETKSLKCSLQSLSRPQDRETGFLVDPPTLGSLLLVLTVPILLVVVDSIPGIPAERGGNDGAVTADAIVTLELECDEAIVASPDDFPRTCVRRLGRLRMMRIVTKALGMAGADVDDGRVVV